MATKNVDVYLDNDVTHNPKAKVTFERDNGDGSILIRVSNPNILTGNISSTGKSYVIGNGVDKFGDVKVSVMVTRPV